MIKVLIYKDPRYPLEVKKIRQKAKEILSGLGLKDRVELSLAFVGARRAKKLNQEFRQQDYFPEVLSFSLEEPRAEDGFLRLGDVMICFPLAREMARRENRMLMEVLADLLDHGIKNLVRHSA